MDFLREEVAGFVGLSVEEARAIAKDQRLELVISMKDGVEQDILPSHPISRVHIPRRVFIGIMGGVIVSSKLEWPLDLSPPAAA